MKKSDIKILVGCECSDAVRGNFEKLGFNAVSCDILPNENPNAKHIQGDLLETIQNYNWDVIICFPPCTDLAVSGAAWFSEKRKTGQQQKSINFFLKIASANCNYIAIENPVGIMSNIYKKPTQIIQPYYFGDTFQKTTCLWLKNLPKLIHYKQRDLFNNTITHVSKGDFITYKGKTKSKWYSDAYNLPKRERAKIRSRTFPGIAEAMAKQWGEYLEQKFLINQ